MKGDKDALVSIKLLLDLFKSFFHLCKASLDGLKYIQKRWLKFARFLRVFHCDTLYHANFAPVDTISLWGCVG